jgi:hypothetical protein
MKQIALVLSAALLIATVLSAGCTTTNYNAPDYTTYLAKYVDNASQNIVVPNGSVTYVKPLSRIGDREYSGVYETTTKDGVKTTYQLQIEPVTSKGAATARYEQLVSEKLNDGYNTTEQKLALPVLSGESENTILVKYPGQDITEGIGIAYYYDTEINEWLVFTIFSENIRE